MKIVKTVTQYSLNQLIVYYNKKEKLDIFVKLVFVNSNVTETEITIKQLVKITMMNLDKTYIQLIKTIL